MKKVIQIFGFCCAFLFLMILRTEIHASSVAEYVNTPVPTSVGFPAERLKPIEEIYCLPFDDKCNFKEEVNAINDVPLSPVRGVIGDIWADVIIGQPDFSQITPDEVVANKLFNPGGVYIDQTVTPNRLYVYDAGNSRILGFSSLGICSAGSNIGRDCTSNSDCPGSYCQIQPNKQPDVILGQPSGFLSGCNLDSGMQSYPANPQATASSLCGMIPSSVSILEAGAMVTMSTDLSGNLYVPDFFNQRVLRYDNPFIYDTEADYVWGQENFSNRECNQGNGYFFPTAGSLCLAPPPGYGNIKTGVAIDINGNLWIADTQNSRVLRYPIDPETGVPEHIPNLVLGQPGFTSRTPGNALNQMDNPASVRVAKDGSVYVADSVNGDGKNGRVLVFYPPFSSGMAAHHTLTSEMGEPTGLEFDSTGGLWVNDCDNMRLMYYLNQSLNKVINGIPTGVWGGMGVDRNNNLYITGWNPQQIIIYSSPTFEWQNTFLTADEYGSMNHLGSRGIMDSLGLEVTSGQLIVSDMTRLLFWNNPTGLTTFQAADGVVGQPDFKTRPKYGAKYGRIRADTHNRIWTVRGHWWETTKILGYQLPLKSGDLPFIEISSPVPLLGGGNFSWSNDLVLAGIEYQSDCDCLWLSDTKFNRVFRIRNVSSNQRVVDIVLGQKDNSGTHCNQGRDSDDGYTHPQFPSQDSLCHPGGITLDNNGNLFVSDHNLELAGNWRLLVFDTELFPTDHSVALFGLPADRIIGRNDDFSEPDCLGDHFLCGPWEPAFNSKGIMAIGFNGYLGDRFVNIFQNPIDNPSLVSSLGDFYSHPISIRYDHFDNLYVLDLTRHRVLIYWNTILERTFIPILQK